jgi:hypothetical protein
MISAKFDRVFRRGMGNHNLMSRNLILIYSPWKSVASYVLKGVRSKSRDQNANLGIQYDIVKIACRSCRFLEKFDGSGHRPIYR